MEDLMRLGGNIELSGFSELDGANMVVVKKIVGNYARKLSDNVKGFEKLRITLKTVHKTEKSEKYEVQGQVVADGKSSNSEVTDRNLYFVIDSVLKKICSELKIA